MALGTVQRRKVGTYYPSGACGSAIAADSHPMAVTAPRGVLARIFGVG